MIIIFNNGLELPYIEGYTNSCYYEGYERSVLEVHISSDIISLDDLNTLLKDSSNTSTITMMDEESGIYNVYNYFQLLKELSSKTITINAAEGIKEDRFVFQLCKITYKEIQEEKNEAQILYTAMMTDTLVEE